MFLVSLRKKLTIFKKKKHSPPFPTPPENPPFLFPWSNRWLFDRPFLTDSFLPVPAFPRYGLSVAQTVDSHGHIYFLGGLVQDMEECHLYRICPDEDSTTFVQTFGDTPSPRLGHGIVLYNDTLTLWGGDTNRNTSQVHDNALYHLTLSTRKWTRSPVAGQTPIGRYGHTVTLLDTNLYVFGGQVDEQFFNDIWVFDLKSLKTVPAWNHAFEPATPDRPPPRTTHTAVAHQDQIIIFGGTDGKYHYNDTWSFNVNTRVWSELQCTGFIPAARESHSAAIVDGIMYVFGGRGVNGQEIGELAALNLQKKRWFKFQNMGLEPCPRSGHRMTVIGKRIYVLGGDAANIRRLSDDFTSAYILDTRLLQYPNL